jgi:hypothetical protein
MNDHRRVDLQDPTIKPKPLRVQRGNSASIYLLAGLLISAMIAWFAFLGWGIVEMLQWLLVWAKSIWTTYF